MFFLCMAARIILSHMQISRLENKQTKQAPSYDESVYFIQYSNYTMIIS